MKSTDLKKYHVNQIKYFCRLSAACVLASSPWPSSSTLLPSFPSSPVLTDNDRASETKNLHNPEK